MSQRIQILDIQHHRNGVAGAPFFAVLFKDLEENRIMLASVFRDTGYCAVYDAGLVSGGNIKFGENSWRGDHYEAMLRPYIQRYVEEL